MTNTNPATAHSAITLSPAERRFMTKLLRSAQMSVQHVHQTYGSRARPGTSSSARTSPWSVSVNENNSRQSARDNVADALALALAATERRLEDVQAIIMANADDITNLVDLIAALANECRLLAGWAAEAGQWDDGAELLRFMIARHAAGPE
jgi:hypothetical protein